MILLPVEVARVGVWSGSENTLLPVEVGWAGAGLGSSSKRREEALEQLLIRVPIATPAVPARIRHRNARRPNVVRLPWLIIVPIACCFQVDVSPFSDLPSQ